MPDEPAPPSLATRAGAFTRSAFTRSLSACTDAPGTAGVLTTLVAFHILRITVGAARMPLSNLCLAAKPILADPLHQAGRLVLSSLAHAGWLHLAFNAFALAPLLSRREAAGPGAVAELAGIAVVGNLLFLGVGTLTATVRALRPYQPGCAVGISGAIFGLMVCEAASRPGAAVVLAGGALTVPALAYPFVLAVALQLLMPGLSAMGHGSGLVAGFGLAQARKAGLVAEPWNGGGGGLPTVGGGSSSSTWTERVSAWWTARAPAGGWSPLPAAESAPRAVGGAGPTVPPAAAAAAAAEARAAAAAAAAAGR